MLNKVSKKPSQRLHVGVGLNLLVSIFTLLYLSVLLVQGAVLDKMAFAATHKINLLSDCIYVTVQYGFGLRINSKVQCFDFLFLVFVDGMPKYVF